MMEYGQKKPRRSASDQTRGGKKGIRELIVDHLKNKIVTQEDAQ